MAKNRLISEILSADEIRTVFTVLRNISTNIFKYENFKNSYILENYLFYNGRACLYKDEHTDLFLPLKIENILAWDIYNRPSEFVATAEDNSYRVNCKANDNAVIIYDNTDYFNAVSFNSILRLTNVYSQKIALCDRIIDLNVFQQKSSKIYQVPAEHKNSFDKVMEKIDTFSPHAIAYKGMNLEEIFTIDTKTDFIADEIFEIRQRLYDDYIQKVGAVSYSENKKERVITDEIYFKQGASTIIRKSRYEARKRAFEEVKKIFGIDIKFDFTQEIPQAGEGGEQKNYDV